MPTRTVVRCVCAVVVLASTIIDAASGGTTAGVVALSISGATLTALLAWSAWRPGYRAPGIGLAAAALGVRSVAAASLVAPAALLTVAATTIAVGSVLVHLRSDPVVLGQRRR